MKLSALDKDFLLKVIDFIRIFEENLNFACLFITHFVEFTQIPIFLESMILASLLDPKLTTIRFQRLIIQVFSVSKTYSFMFKTSLSFTVLSFMLLLS
jgi:hypothetical protein